MLFRSLAEPHIPGFNPDPTIIRTGNDYFLATSTFEFFPGVPIYHSTDLIKWDLIGHAYNRPSQLNMRGTAPSGGIFAPNLRFHRGTYYLITTWFDVISPPDDVSRLPRSMYVTTNNIFDETSWSDPIYVDQQGFDPDLFFDTDGKVYLSIFTSEIDIKTGDALTESKFSHSSPLPLDTPRLAEGSHIFKINGTYHMIAAEAGTAVNQREMSYRSKSPFGPWEENPHNPILYNGRNLSQPVLSTGHADIVQTPEGDWWAVFLATSKIQRQVRDFPSLGAKRSSLHWCGKTGWPVIHGGKDITLTMPGLYDLPRPKLWRDSFVHGKFGDKAYYTQRTPYKAFHEFPPAGGISIRGNLYTLSDRETPAAFLRKQVDIGTIWSTHLTEVQADDPSIFASTRTGEFANLTTVYADLPRGAEKDGARPMGREAPTYIASVENKWLQSFVPGWQNFVGSHFGFYASGNGLLMLQKAHFAYVQTELL
ncbi:glycosyl hydrolase [Mycena rebaudengoi]|nr:glycosyl hydrolase [Mycena rebaudengoi]